MFFVSKAYTSTVYVCVGKQHANKIARHLQIRGISSKNQVDPWLPPKLLFHIPNQRMQRNFMCFAKDPAGDLWVILREILPQNPDSHFNQSSMMVENNRFHLKMV